MGKMRTNVLATWTQVCVNSPVEDIGVSPSALAADGGAKLGCAPLAPACPFCLGRAGLASGECAPRTPVMLSLDMALRSRDQGVTMRGEAACDPAPMCRGTETAALRGSDLCLTHLHASPLPPGELSLRTQYSATTTRPQMHLLRVKIASQSQSVSPSVAARLGNGHLRKRTRDHARSSTPIGHGRAKCRKLNKYPHLVARS